MLISSFLGFGAFFYIGNYTLYRHYFKKPLNQLTFKGIIKRDLKQWIHRKFAISLKQDPYQVEFKFGINHKPLQCKYIHINQSLTFYYTIFMLRQNGQYQHLTKNNQKTIVNFEEGIDQLIKQNYNSDYLLVSLFHSQDEMNNLYQVQVQKQIFKNQTQENSIQSLVNDYLYIFMKKNDQVIICQQFGNNSKDIDFIDKIINHTIKNDKQISCIDITEQWFQENKEFIKCIIKLNDQYQLIQINKVDGYQIGDSNQNNQIYQKILDNINGKLIQYLYE